MRTLADLPTPAFLVDRARVEANTRRMQERAERLGVGLRPHVKTHKTLEAGRLQLSQQEHKRIIVSTLAEAEMFAAAGFDDITYAMPITEDKLERCAALAEKIRANLFLDSMEALRDVEAFAAGRSPTVTFHAFIKVDTGYRRAGVEYRSALLIELAKAVAASKAVRLTGIYSHAGHSYAAESAPAAHAAAREEAERMVEACGRLREAGVEVPVVSVGSTPSASCCEEYPRPPPGTTLEIHPGAYVFYDRQQEHIGACTIDDVACSVLARVVGVYPHSNQLLIDAGALALSKDGARQGCFGAVAGHPELRLTRVTQEVGVIECGPAGHGEEGPAAKRPRVDLSQFKRGMLLRILPNHCCLAAACFDKYFVVEGDKVVDEWRPCKFW
eukprot:tig00000241_g20934.t1